MKTNVWTRIVILAAIMAWPGVETYRYCAAKQQLAIAEQNAEKVNQRLTQARAKAAATQVVKTTPDPAGQEP